MGLKVFKDELDRAVTQGAVAHQGSLFVSEIDGDSQIAPAMQQAWRTLVKPESAARDINDDARAFLENHVAEYWNAVPAGKRDWFLEGFVLRVSALKFIKRVP